MMTLEKDQLFCLRWNNFHNSILSAFDALRIDGDFVDVTLSCDSRQLQAHRVVLSACSPYFRELLKENPCSHPIIILHDVPFSHLEKLLAFMYAGQVVVSQAQLGAFLQTADILKIRGLADTQTKCTDIKEKDSSQAKRSSSPQPPGKVSPTLATLLGAGDDDEGPSPKRTRPSISPETIITPKIEKIEREEEGEVDQESIDGMMEGELSMDGISEQLAPAISLSQASSQNSTNTNAQSQPQSPSTHTDSKHPQNTPGIRPYLDNGLDSPGETKPWTSSGSSATAPQEGGGAGGDGRRLHSLDPRPCPICHRTYSNLSNLRQHMRIIHTPQQAVCPLCGKSFKTELYLRRHLASFHEITHQNRGFMAPSNMTSEMMSALNMMGPIALANYLHNPNAQGYSSSSSLEGESTRPNQGFHNQNVYRDEGEIKCSEEENDGSGGSVDQKPDVSVSVS